MNNKLSVWYDIEKLEEVKKTIKESLQRDYCFAESEFEKTENGFKFLFDDETNGDIEISFIPEHNTLKVMVSGTWAWEVIEIYHRILPDNPEEQIA